MKITKTCKNCQISFPDHLINLMVVNDERNLLCPVCALKIRNKIHGFPLDMPFGGTRAQELYDEAMDWLEKNGGDK